MKNLVIKEVIQSGHINILIGSGCSRPYLNTLSDIEKKMNNEKTREQAQYDVICGYTIIPCFPANRISNASTLFKLNSRKRILTTKAHRTSGSQAKKGRKQED
ncbi:MAG: hypothetical protein LBR10_07055 [Prevotellaceae bacterium]|jgi:hypothetical protein|nr:hypothetical protein [Prevotellaceae bacterium]